MPTLNKLITHQNIRKALFYIISVALTILLLVGLCLTYYICTYNSTRDAAEQQTTELGADASLAASLYFEKVFAELRAVSNKLSEELPSKVPESYLAAGNGIESVNLIFGNGAGSYHYFADNGAKVNLINNAYYDNGSFSGRDTKHYAFGKLFFTIPIYRNGAVAAAIEGSVQSGALTALLAEISHFDNVLLAVVNDKYEIVCKPNDKLPDNLFDKLSVSAFPDGKSFLGLRAALDNKEASFATNFGDSGKYGSFVAFHKIDDSGWYTVSYAETDAVDIMYKNMFGSVSIIIGLVILLFIVFISVFCFFILRAIKKDKTELYELSLLTENIPCGVFSCSKDSAFTLLSESEGFLKMLSYTAEEIATVCNNSLWELVYQADRITFSQAVFSQLQYGNTVESEFRLIKKDGNLIWVRNTGKMVRVSGVETLYCVALDITEAKRYNEQLASTSDDLKSITDVIPGGLARVSLSDNYDIIMANASFYHLCGYTPDDFRIHLKGGMNEIIDSRDREKLKRHITTSNLDGDPIITEFRIVKKDGKSIWLSMHARKTLAANDSSYELLCVFTDISSLREAYNQAKADREKARTLAAMATDIIFEYDIKTDEFQFTGNKLMDLPQVIPNAHQRISVSKHLSMATSFNFDDILNEVFKNGKAEMEEVCINNSDGSMVRWYNVYAYSITYGTSPIIIGKMVDVTQRKHEMEALREANKRDPLTNLYNTSSTRYYIDRFLNELGKNPKDNLHAFMILDIDNFKNFNDILGHATGDAVLIEISQKLGSLFRNTDIIGRVGGDEFVLLIKDFTSSDKIKEKAKEICNGFENIYFGNKTQNLKLSVSIGIALAGKDGNTYHDLLEKADKALYNVKSAGKNSFKFYFET